MNSPGVSVGDGDGARVLVSDTGVGATVTVDGSGRAIIDTGEVLIFKNCLPYNYYLRTNFNFERLANSNLELYLNLGIKNAISQSCIQHNEWYLHIYSSIMFVQGIKC